MSNLLHSSSDGNQTPSPVVKNRNACLRSFCVFFSSFSQGQEDRMMEKILFFHPSHAPPSAQMNHVGFCIGIACLAERFAASQSLEEIRTDNGTVSLYSPLPELWIAAETAGAFGSSAVVPLLRLGFDAFVLLHGRDTVTALVDPHAHTAHAALQDFFGRFAGFLESRVLLVDIHPALHGPLRRRRWLALAGAEGLLAYAPSPRVASAADRAMCHSIAARWASLSGGSGASSAAPATAGRCGGWGTEHNGLAPDMAAASVVTSSAEQRLTWTACRYIVFEAATLRVIASCLTADSAAQLACLLLMNPEMEEFVAFAEDGTVPLRGSVSSTKSVIAVMLMEADMCLTMQHSLSDVCTSLAVDITEFLVTGNCSFTQRSSLDPEEGQLTATALGKPQCCSTYHSVVSLLKHFNTKLTVQWTLWHNGFLFGTPMRKYPRAVHWVLSSVLRALIRNRGNTYAYSDATKTHKSEFPDEGPFFLCVDVPSETNEIWMPMRGSIWIYGCEYQGRVCGAAFYNFASLGCCFHAAAELCRQMFTVC